MPLGDRSTVEVEQLLYDIEDKVQKLLLISDQLQTNANNAKYNLEELCYNLAMKSTTQLAKKHGFKKGREKN